jgi:Zn-finger nucleic acid-binding protein
MSESARIYSCPNCGGPTSESARRCEHCTAPVATERCVHCFQMNVTSARHCSGCGRELGSSPPLETSSTQCPSCRVPLSALSEASGALFDCSRCAGQFVEHGRLRHLLERPAELGRAVPSPIKPVNPLAQKVSYRPCPLCATLMHRRNFGGLSGVIVDICTLHGIWFDAGELPSVLAFVEGGGLERSRLREREAERVVAQRVTLTQVNLGANDGDMNLRFSDLADAATELLDFVRKLIKPRQ